MHFRKHNFLNKFMPGVTNPSLRFYHLCRVGKQWYDMLVTNTTPYYGMNYARNGAFGMMRHGGFGNINLMSDTSLGLDFTIVKSGTSDPAMVASTVFSVTDMDTGHEGQTEFVTTKGFSKVHMTKDTQIVRVENKDGTETFSATRYGGMSDNPENPLKMTDRKSVV